ncbi:MAG: glycosyltransferase family 2 protein [Victivallaceae bacterium]
MSDFRSPFNSIESATGYIYRTVQSPLMFTMRRIASPGTIKLLTFALLITALATGAAYMPLRSIYTDSTSHILMAVGVGVLLLNIIYYTYLLFLAFFGYKPHPTLSDDQLPSCMVIVPAYNEGRNVLNALESVMASDYPLDKLEILAVDDGSVDDTWEWISEVAARSNGRITPIKLEKNGGKRNALYYGITNSKADVIVTVDSDSVVFPDTLRVLNSPFVDSKIGGVAGNIRVLNTKDGSIPRMMDVNFVFNFEIIRSAQSAIRSVFCTPGALSAYRRSAILPFLDEWVKQMFFGQAAHIAEDRALTTYLLRNGHEVVFQRDAIALTEVPSRYRTLCKMFMRWGRGDIRETMVMYEFAFKKTNWHQLGIQFNLLMQTIWLITPVFLLPTLVYGLINAPVSFSMTLLASLIVWATLPAVIFVWRYGSSEALWAYTFAIFNFCFLSWIGPYCIVTVRNSKWMTRAKQVAVVKPVAVKPAPSAGNSQPSI